MWRTPDGNASYIFSVPGNENNGGEVTIEYDKTPIITEWIQ